jgi:hypothetical protein
MREVSEAEAPQYGNISLRVEIPSDDGQVPVVYANNVGVTFSPHDMTLHFSWFAVPPTGEPPPAGTVVPATVRLVSKVSIPLTMVRAFADLLDGQADAWEASFGGKIPLVQSRAEQEREAEETRSTE